MEEKFKKLRTFNLVMAVIHYIQGAAILYLSNNFNLPATSSFLQFDKSTQSLAPHYQTLFSLNIGPLVALFLFISSFGHLLVGTIFNKWYNQNLAKGINLARWIEYFFSASLMVVIIAMLVGIYDIGTLILIFFLNGLSILCGWMMEVHNENNQKIHWTSFYFGCIAGISIWSVIALYLFGAGGGVNQAPTFVYWIFFSIFLVFNTFVVNIVLQYKKVGKWTDYLYGERAFIILSLVAKSLLAWQVFAGTLRPM